MLLLLVCGDIESCPGPFQNIDDFMKVKGMKIFHQNIRGLFGKFECLEELFDRHSSIDIRALTETHIIDGQYDDNDSLFKIPGYLLNYSKYEPEEMKEDFRNVNWEQVYNKNYVNDCLNMF